MHEPTRTETFDGVAGRVLMGALSVEAVFTGIVVVGFLKAAELGLTRIGQTDNMFYVAFVLFSFLLVRFAMNGLAGEERGSFLSAEGGPSGPAIGITLRFLALWVLWLVPLEIMSLTPEKVTLAFMSLATQQGGGETIGMTVLAVTLMAICPPIFLIMSVGSPTFFEVFIPARWANMFRGRLSHLFLIYVLYLGGLSVVASLGLPVMIVASIYNSLAGTILGWVMLVILAGVAVDLLGRLCGFFVLSGDAEPKTTDGTASDAPTGTAGPDLSPLVSVSATPAGGPEGLAEANAKPVLQDARGHLQAIVEWFQTNPDRVLLELEDLRNQYAPDPLVLHSLCVLYHRAGQPEDSAGIAREALMVCVKHKATRLAADILALHLDRMQEFGLDRNWLVALAESLRTHNDLEKAEAVYRALFEQEPLDTRVIKGLLQLAESCLQHNTDLDRARRIYAFLQERTSPQSPLVKFMQDGLAEVERRRAA